MSTLIEQIKQLSAAEDFFDFFRLPYDRHVVDVSRLHILKRMGEYLEAESFAGRSDDDVFLAVRAVLARAYADFARSSPAEQKVFKVFRDQAARRAGGFVGIDALTAPGPTSPSQTRQPTRQAPAASPADERQPFEES